MFFFVCEYKAKYVTAPSDAQLGLLFIFILFSLPTKLLLCCCFLAVALRFHLTGLPSSGTKPHKGLLQ